AYLIPAQVRHGRFVLWRNRGMRYYWPEAQRIQAKLRARAHGENVANNSADTCGCPLKRLDRAGVIVALDFERDCPAVTNVDYARIFFAGFDQNIRAGRGKLLQFFP